MSVRDLSCASAETWKDMGPIKNRMKAALEVAWGATAPPRMLITLMWYIHLVNQSNILEPHENWNVLSWGSHSTSPVLGQC